MAKINISPDGSLLFCLYCYYPNFRKHGVMGDLFQGYQCDSSHQTDLILGFRTGPGKVNTKSPSGIILMAGKDICGNRLSHLSSSQHQR